MRNKIATLTFILLPLMAVAQTTVTAVTEGTAGSSGSASMQQINGSTSSSAAQSAAQYNQDYQNALQQEQQDNQAAASASQAASTASENATTAQNNATRDANLATQDQQAGDASQAAYYQQQAQYWSTQATQDTQQAQTDASDASTDKANAQQEAQNAAAYKSAYNMAKGAMIKAQNEANSNNALVGNLDPTSNVYDPNAPVSAIIANASAKAATTNSSIASTLSSALTTAGVTQSASSYLNSSGAGQVTDVKQATNAYSGGVSGSVSSLTASGPGSSLATAQSTLNSLQRTSPDQGLIYTRDRINSLLQRIALLPAGDTSDEIALQTQILNILYEADAGFESANNPTTPYTDEIVSDLATLRGNTVVAQTLENNGPTAVPPMPLSTAQIQQVVTDVLGEQQVFSWTMPGSPAYNVAPLNVQVGNQQVQVQ